MMVCFNTMNLWLAGIRSFWILGFLDQGWPATRVYSGGPPNSELPSHMRYFPMTYYTCRTRYVQECRLLKSQVS